MKTKLLVAMVAALAVLGASVADAASRKGKRHKVTRAPAPVVVQGAVPYTAYRAAPGVPANRPPWAGPNECFTDEGYGRFTPCDISKDNF